MGKIEKVVVLSVGFLMIVMFVVLTTGSKGTQSETERFAKLDNPSGRLRSNDRGDLGSVGGRKLGTPPVLAANRKRGGQNSRTDRVKPASTEGLLSTTVRQGSTLREKALAPKRVDRANQQGPKAGVSGLVRPKLEPVQKPGLDPTWTLVRVDGLVDTIDPMYKTYQCSNGDTFEKVARRFYGDQRHAQFLRRNNEGVRSLASGQVLLMPVVDEAAFANIYTVREGDSLWSIAKDQYKAGHRWNEIYEANRHVLSRPDGLRLGLELTIP